MTSITSDEYEAERVHGRATLGFSFTILNL
nr:MAG TPA: hypothetical protein [Caudoviricetes sp.]